MKVRIQAGDKPITGTYEIQGDVHQLAAGDHVIVEYDNTLGYADDVHIEHAAQGVTIHIPSAAWRVWSSDGAEISP
ncbi:hypothetical protein [Nocardia inohanensis]|uniref:hypothetical protein n=1 Tax=Nocardia inohanensis TaxID=209246 RepID=UPI0008327555|nr:hypothetical protein [Nocardia inohanensis]